MLMRRRRPWPRQQTGEPLNQNACIQKMEARPDAEQRRKKEKRK
jgi:hypothetical protein